MLNSRIAFLRCKAGMSQAALANRLGVSPSAVGMYEQGRREPSGDLLIAMANIFHVSTDYLLTGREHIGSSRDDLSAHLLETVQQRPFRAAKTPDQPFSREELSVLIAALLIEK